MAEVGPLPPVTLAQPVLPLADCCHWIQPVESLRVTVVPLPAHTGEAAGAAVPPTAAANAVALASTESRLSPKLLVAVTT